jgi:hypothetical protein
VCAACTAHLILYLITWIIYVVEFTLRTTYTIGEQRLQLTASVISQQNSASFNETSIVRRSGKHCIRPAIKGQGVCITFRRTALDDWGKSVESRHLIHKIQLMYICFCCWIALIEDRDLGESVVVLYI